MSSLTPQSEFARSMVKLLTKIENRVGLKISPCFTPNGQSKKSVFILDFSEVRTTLVTGLEYRANRDLYIFPTIPKEERTLNSNI